MTLDEKVLDLLTEAGDRLDEAHRSIVSEGIVGDPWDDPTLQRLRRLSQDVTELHDRVQDNGLVEV